MAFSLRVFLLPEWVFLRLPSWPKLLQKALYKKKSRGNSFCNFYKNTLHSARKSWKKTTKLLQKSVCLSEVCFKLLFNNQSLNEAINLELLCFESLRLCTVIGGVGLPVK